MPPKPIVITEDVILASLSLVRAKGMESVNARSLAEVLGCSTKPLFRLFKNMDELKKDLLSQINKYCSDYLLAYPDFNKNPVGAALRYISFAKNEPNFFKALFMGSSITQKTLSLMLIDKELEPLLHEISNSAKISKHKAQAVYKNMWLMSHGIASIIATNSSSIEMDEAESILTDAYKGFVFSAKNGG